MNALNRLLRVEPVALLGLGTALQALLVLLGADKALLAAVGAVLVAGTVVVRQLVSPLPTVAAAVLESANTTAKATAENLSEETVGAAGRLPMAAEQVADRTASLVAAATLKSIGVPVPSKH